MERDVEATLHAQMLEPNGVSGFKTRKKPYFYGNMDGPPIICAEISATNLCIAESILDITIAKLEVKLKQSKEQREKDLEMIEPIRKEMIAMQAL